MVRTKAEAKHKKNSKSTPVPVKDGGNKKSRTKRAKPGKKALREIRHAQDCRESGNSSAKKAISNAAFDRCMRDIVQETKGGLSISPRAIAILKAESEEYLRTTFSLATGITTSRKGQMLTVADMRFAHNILTNPHMLREKGGTERMMMKSSSKQLSLYAKTDFEPEAKKNCLNDKKESLASKDCKEKNLDKSNMQAASAKDVFKKKMKNFSEKEMNDDEKGNVKEDKAKESDKANESDEEFHEAE